MFTVIGIMFAGIAAGYLLRKIELLQKIGKPISYTILLLLFLLGISVGANKDIVDNLATLGGQAFLLALAGTVGSVLAGWESIVCFLKKGVADERKSDRYSILLCRLYHGSFQ